MGQAVYTDCLLLILGIPRQGRYVAAAVRGELWPPRARLVSAAASAWGAEKMGGRADFGWFRLLCEVFRPGDI
ncbi:MAG: hypothetical protein AAFV53_14110 [Myxococcota bacterium]